MQRQPYRQVPLVRRDGSIAAHALVDEQSYAALVAFRWHIGSNGYARRNENGAAILMHRVVIGFVPGDPREVDHINRDPLDNRRGNLRAVSHAQNMQNKVSYRGSSSRFRAVYWEANKRMWRARPQLNGTRISVGQFRDEIDAALAVDAWRRENMPFAMPDPALEEFRRAA